MYRHLFGKELQTAICRIASLSPEVRISPAEDLTDFQGKNGVSRSLCPGSAITLKERSGQSSDPIARFFPRRLLDWHLDNQTKEAAL